MTDIHVGDVVRTPRGRVEWTVTRLAPAHGVAGSGKVVASLRSENGSRNRLLTDHLVLVQAAASPAASWEERRNGAIFLDGQVVRCSDNYVHAAIEWRWPRYGDPDPYDDIEPRGLVAEVTVADDDGERWVQLNLIGALDRKGGVSLRQEQAADLAIALLTMSRNAGPNHTPGA